MALVLDCSVAIAWTFEDEQSAFSQEAMAHAFEHGGHVPALWWWEFGNALSFGVKRSRISRDEAAVLLGQPAWNDLVTDAAPSAALVNNTFALALAYGLTVYDAAYLELAIRLAVPLATLDKRLAAAAVAAGAALFRPDAEEQGVLFGSD